MITRMKIEGSRKRRREEGKDNFTVNLTMKTLLGRSQIQKKNLMLLWNKMKKTTKKSMGKSKNLMKTTNFLKKMKKRYNLQM
jgi:hypothetical protein